MKIIINSIVGVFFSLVIFLFTIGYISAANDATTANTYLQKCSAELQVCNFNDAVAQQLIEEAKENGYVLTIDVKRDGYGDALYATIEIEYVYRIPIIGLESKHTKSIISK